MVRGFWEELELLASHGTSGKQLPKHQTGSRTPARWGSAKSPMGLLWFPEAERSSQAGGPSQRLHAHGLRLLGGHGRFHWGSDSGKWAHVGGCAPFHPLSVQLRASEAGGDAEPRPNVPKRCHLVFLLPSCGWLPGDTDIPLGDLTDHPRPGVEQLCEARVLLSTLIKAPNKGPGLAEALSASPGTMSEGPF